MVVVFFFKQKTAYEMRISDWSSDVCSSDLFADFNGKIAKAELTDADRADLIARGTAALKGGFATGYRALIAHLRAAEAKADETAGVWKLPDGQAYYAAQLESYTKLRSEEHTSELQSLMRISYAVCGFKKKHN